jgi:hypothetical protein
MLKIKVTEIKQWYGAAFIGQTKEKGN